MSNTTHRNPQEGIREKICPYELSRREFRNLLNQGPEYNLDLAEAVQQWHRISTDTKPQSRNCPVLGLEFWGSYHLSHVPREVWDTEFRYKVGKDNSTDWLDLLYESD